MAKVTIVLTDSPDDSVNFLMESEPAFPGPRSKTDPTEAQRLAMGLLEHLQGGSVYVQNGETQYDGVTYDEDEPSEKN